MILSFSKMVGLSGVDNNENARARRIGRMFEWPMILIAFWIVFEWYLEARADGPLPYTYITDWFLWTFFLLETLVLTAVVDDKARYLRNNWSNLVIVIAGMPLLWQAFPHAGGLRALRLLAMFTMLMNMSGSFQKIMGRNHLGPTLMVSFIIIIMAGTLMAVIDPNVQTPMDGIWWAWVTVTTVGYGDIVPGSTAGRLFGSVLILMGIGLFSMMTASFSAFFMQQEEEDLIAKETANADRLAKMESRMEQLETKLDQLLTIALEAEQQRREQGRDLDGGER
ncbi:MULTISPECIES: potassium channel family protein [Oceanospirillaceae]|jgi:voltage-gated potassium channel|uniref:Potassium channel family protein n=1 Tax=Thalassolituus pacificus TaxID=2975440 RepID=A0A9X2WH25_9GAMM|nr:MULTISPECIES: potassium channel family protein [Thalassolituus]MAY14163.1 ion transporter [Oceanospirillaceae bacterium]MCB2388108.1 potassium channel family protein [Thalassolituus alkanivorans]MCB2424647.1 potassium channel family protein [Thalassolituus alkanivorans]MCT7360011.1 potassium channel family protein [Thalassolituus pacificus]